MARLKKGDKCRVRLSDGPIVDAVYSHEIVGISKLHVVRVCGFGNGSRSRIANGKPKGVTYCRFITPPAVIKKAQ